MLAELYAVLDAKKKRLDSYRPFPADFVTNIDAWYRVELTYTSNAIEGNTLSRQETSLVINDHQTVAGKTVNEHLEALNHVEALRYATHLAQKTPSDLSESDVLELHRLVLQKIDDRNAGRYRSVGVRIAGSTTILPNPLKVPELMASFLVWLTSAETTLHPVACAAEAHLRLVTIHPFIDGNGRTARLLMNLLLERAGFPPVVIRPEDRRHYLASLEQAQTGGSSDMYHRLIVEAAERSLDTYLELLEQTIR